MVNREVELIEAIKKVMNEKDDRVGYMIKSKNPFPEERNKAAIRNILTNYLSTVSKKEVMKITIENCLDGEIVVNFQDDNKRSQSLEVLLKILKQKKINCFVYNYGESDDDEYWSFSVFKIRGAKGKVEFKEILRQLEREKKLKILKEDWPEGNVGS